METTAFEMLVVPTSEAVLAAMFVGSILQSLLVALNRALPGSKPRHRSSVATTASRLELAVLLAPKSARTERNDEMALLNAPAKQVRSPRPRWL